MNHVYIALGTNIEPRNQHLKSAMESLRASENITILNRSSIYQTAPVGYTDQDDFLNMVIEIETTYASEELLAVCQQVEQELGRKREIRFGPRTIDLDILVYNEENKNSEHLSIPHPRMHERGFVLIPLNEIAPELIIPSTDKTVKEWLAELPEQDKKDINKWNESE
ncbi:2-amino-4-hydroxy-6-hydroxymethyldihydropteridine diphosphokinase [Ornithinibacillus contaminans]|uniref:2-amino-4-hydroxy-6- hydroxymethyldihydropteridine diphosphokinase n=1 Tax=Ornithinibacillus contaminans TaxID=694055 RepID=UPI00064DC5C1|nr:2-amino-4-hydroxy-6-hydroxymethyldihydropteridine diphosphokinase [Ornithinibacillus contaminans]